MDPFRNYEDFWILQEIVQLQQNAGFLGEDPEEGGERGCSGWEDLK